MTQIKTFFALIIFAFNQILATNYYIDATNGNDYNSGKSPLQAWKTCNKINLSWNSIMPGDSLLFKRGEIWAPTSSNMILHIVNRSGSVGSPIVFGAYGVGQLPIISNINSGGTADIYSFMGQNIKYFIIQDIEFKGNFLIYTDGNNGVTNIKVLRCTIDGTSTYASGILFIQTGWIETTPENFSGLYPISNIEVGYCTIKNSDATAIKFNNATKNIWIHNNKIYNTGLGGITLGGGDNSIVEYNLISGTSGEGIKIEPQLHTIDSLVIRYNLVMGIGSSSNCALCIYNSRRTKIYNNTFYAPNIGQISALFGWMPAKPVYFSGKGTWGFENNTIANNIFYGTVVLSVPNNEPITYRDRTTINYTFQDVWIKNYFKNNIYYKPSSDNIIYKWEYGSNNSISYDANVPGHYVYPAIPPVYSIIATTANFISNWSNKSNVSLDKNMDPKLSNPSWISANSYGDFHLSENSPAKETGYSIGGIKDLDGHPVPASKPDIGCYQTFTEQKTLDLLTPDNLENLFVGTSYNITWTSTQINNIKLEYTTNNGTSWNSINNSVPAGSGSYTWTVPAAPSSLCKVRISDASDPAVNDVSNNIFTIYLPALSLTAPNGGENWFSGQTYTITWTSNNIDNIKLEYSTNNGTSWIIINDSISASSGNFSWNIPIVSSLLCKVKISSVNNPSLNSVSNNTFSILQPALSLTSPNSGETWITGEVHNITWNSTDITALRIDYTTNNGASWNNISPNTAAGTGSYAWTIPNVQSSNCKVKIADVNNSINNDQSDNIFTISNPYIDVNIRIFLQSPFNNGLMNTTLRDNGLLPLNQPYNVPPWNYTGNETVVSVPNGIVDWILLELRRDTSATSIVARRAAFLTGSGNVVDIDGTSNVKFYNINEGNYYIAVKHRNHLGIMTASSINITRTTPLYDFTTGLNKAFGNNSMNMLSDGVYGMCSGDANVDGTVNILDYGVVGNAIFNTGYLREDIDMNGIVNVLDYQKIYINIFKFSLVRN